MSGLIWALFGVSLVFTVAVVLLRRPRAEQGELLRLRESPAVGVIGLVLWGFCLWVGLTLDRREGIGAELTLFLLVGLVLSCVSLLWYLVRCTIVTADRVIAVGPLGGRVTLRWAEIIRLKLENGRLVQMAAFAVIAKEHLKSGVGTAVLDQLKR